MEQAQQGGQRRGERCQMGRQKKMNRRHRGGKRHCQFGTEFVREDAHIRTVGSIQRPQRRHRPGNGDGPTHRRTIGLPRHQQRAAHEYREPEHRQDQQLASRGDTRQGYTRERLTASKPGQETDDADGDTKQRQCSGNDQGVARRS